MNKFSILKSFFPLSFFFFLFSAVAGAASFSVKPQDLAAGKETAVVLSVDTEEQEINAVELRLKFSPDEFLIKGISDGNSIINLWIEKPKFSNPPAGGQGKGEISFSGIIPGGFEGKDAELAKIVAVPKKPSEASFEISEAKVLLNDGDGTEAKLNLSNLKFNVAEANLQPEAGLPAKDTEPPESFAPQIARDPNIFGGKYFLAFAAQDKGAGIDHYEILEVRQGYGIENYFPFTKYFRNESWVTAESPYFLADQKLQSRIYVKAVDKAGNARIAEVSPANPRAWYENYLICAIIISVALIIIAGYIIWRTLWRKEKR